MAEANVNPAGPAPTIRISDKIVDPVLLTAGLTLVAINRLTNIEFILSDESTSLIFKFVAYKS